MQLHVSDFIDALSTICFFDLESEKWYKWHTRSSYTVIVIIVLEAFCSLCTVSPMVWSRIIRDVKSGKYRFPLELWTTSWRGTPQMRKPLQQMHGSHMKRFTQEYNNSSTEMASTIWDKALRRHRLFDNWFQTWIFIKNLTKSIFHSMRSYLSRKKQAMVHSLKLHSKLLKKLHERLWNPASPANID